MSSSATAAEGNLSGSLSDHQPNGRTSVQVYEGDSEAQIKEELTEFHKVLSNDRCHNSPSGMDFDSSIGQPPYSQHIRQVHVIKPASNSPHTRHHRGCNWTDSDKVALLVDGKRFIISPSLLIKHPNTMLGR